MQQKILSILKQLISYESVTPNGDEAIHYISDLLSSNGFHCEIKHFGPDGEAEKGDDGAVANLYAVYGEDEPNICFAGHVDVVLPGNISSWLSDPYKMTIIDDKIYGRGTVDMKGALACSLAAALEFLQENAKRELNISGAISFLITGDEEGHAQYGTKKMLEYIKDRSPKINFCILGEPTTLENIGDVVKIGRRGSINFALEIKGKQGHVAYPEKAINPLDMMVNILKELKGKILDEGTEFFQPSNLELTSIDVGNQASNVIPESVIAKFNIRFNSLHNFESLLDKIHSTIDKYSNNYNLEYEPVSLAFIQKYSSKMQKFVEIIEQECQIKTDISTGGGSSDARFIHHYAEVIEFGLNCNLAHKINEYTKISDLQKLYNVYYNTLIGFL